MVDSDYQMDMVRRRKAELEAALGVISAQQALRFIYQSELDEINAFLDAVDQRVEELKKEQAEND